jgi:CRISPR-associated protein Csm4
MQYNVIKLFFNSPLHISKGKLNSYESSEEYLHSDTIKSALFVSVLQLYGEEEANKFMDQIVVSSAFPFDERAYYLPRPLNFRPQEEGSATTRKEAKKIAFLTIRQFEDAINGRQVDGLLDDEGKARQPVIWHREMTQRVKVNYDSDSEPFYMEKLYPTDPDNRGYYFIYQGGYDSAKMWAALRLLGENGIGHQRNLGNGRFRVEKSTVTINHPSTATTWISLSLLHPGSQTELAEAVGTHSRYLIKKRGGWISSPTDIAFLRKRKKAVLMFVEGSVFSFKSPEAPIVKGQKLDVKPEEDSHFHPVWRDGRSILLPIVDPLNQ